MAGAGSCVGQTQGRSCWTRWQQLRGSCRTSPCQRQPGQMALLASSAQKSCSGLSKSRFEAAGCASPSSPQPGREQPLPTSGYPGLPHGCLKIQAPFLQAHSRRPCTPLHPDHLIPSAVPPLTFFCVGSFFPPSLLTSSLLFFFFSVVTFPLACGSFPARAVGGHDPHHCDSDLRNQHGPLQRTQACSCTPI